jgi:hypothetical protein
MVDVIDVVTTRLKDLSVHVLLAFCLILMIKLALILMNVQTVTEEVAAMAASTTMAAMNAFVLLATE